MSILFGTAIACGLKSFPYLNLRILDLFCHASQIADRTKKEDERKRTEKDISRLKHFHQLDSLLLQLDSVDCERVMAGNRGKNGASLNDTTVPFGSSLFSWDTPSKRDPTPLRFSTEQQINSLKSRFESELDGNMLWLVAKGKGKTSKELVMGQLRKHSIAHGKTELAKRMIAYRYDATSVCENGDALPFQLSPNETIGLLNCVVSKEVRKDALPFHVGLNGGYGEGCYQFSQRWLDAVKKSHDGGQAVEFNGDLGWRIDDGALNLVTIYYKGKIENGVWSGKVQIQDKFDMNPIWDWRPGNVGRNYGGEWRTRVGYITESLGYEFQVVSPWTDATTEKYHYPR